MIKAIFLAAPDGHACAGFLDAVRALPGIDLTVSTDWAGLSSGELARVIRACDLLIASRQPRVPDELAADPGRLKYICYLHGTMRKVIGLPIIRSGIKVTNWGDAAGYGLAESSLTLLLAVVKDLPRRILAVRGGDGHGIRSVGGTLAGLRVGVYGFGYGGREFVRLLAPFGARVSVFDPFVNDISATVTRVASLRELFASSQAMVIMAGLTEQTRGSVTRELLAMLPDHGVFINTARGAIVDQAALFDELKAGRLRAGLDVLWPDDLPADHEARQWDNLIWTCHEFSGAPWPGGKDGGCDGRQYAIALGNIKAFAAGEPLRFTIDETRYERMT